MTTPHKHQATINAWAAGAQIQCRRNDRDRWEDTDHPGWSPDFQYRVKSPHQALIDAHEAGEIIEVESNAATYWNAVFEPQWRPGLNYRISPRSAELKELIAAHKAGKQIQRKGGNGWVDTYPTWSSMFEYRIKDRFADLKKAFAEGKLIESFDASLGQFCVNLCPTWDESVEHRLCPRQDELKPVIEAHLKGKQIEFFQRGVARCWLECEFAPKWQAIHDYRVKTRWQAELDAWRAGKKIECRGTDRADTWDVLTANLDYYLLNPSDYLEYRIFDEYRDLKEAEARGEVIEQARNINGLWYAQTSPCTWVDQVSHYRVSPRSETLRPIIDAWKAGKQIQTPLDEAATKWRDMDVTPMFDSKTTYRIKPEEVWPKELDAYLKGEVIQCFARDEWHDQDRSYALEKELRGGKLGLKFRIKHKHQAVIDAYEAGQTVQCLLETGEWHDHKKTDRRDSPCFSEDWEYRIKQPHQEVRDAFAAGKAVQYRTNTACPWADGKNPLWYPDWQYRIKPEALKSRRYIYNRAGKKQVGICDPNNHHQVPASTFVRWIDDDWVETEV